MRKAKMPPRGMLTFLFTMVVFCIFVITAAAVGLIVFLLTQMGVFQDSGGYSLGVSITVTIAASVVVGTLVAGLVSTIPLKPLNKLISGMERLAKGDYEARLDLGEGRIGREISQSFNTLASELKNTEMLRSDFVNNFSHEFKTPIVSIRGFARLLQKGELPRETRDEYLGIIVEESSRLSEMATKVLDLAKVENQSILTGITSFNLSEQIRSCILLLERKWEKKNLDIHAEFGEYEWRGNEEFLKQVWINLLDNAVKFSVEKGEIGIRISLDASCLKVSVQNTGEPIREEEKNRLFQKFYQADASHASEGTGIGLAIVKRIVELHGGEVFAQSAGNTTVFTVSLPALPGGGLKIRRFEGRKKAAFQSRSHLAGFVSFQFRFQAYLYTVLQRKGTGAERSSGCLCLFTG